MDKMKMTVLTRQEVINHGFYQVCIFSEVESRFVYVDVDGSQVWDCYKAYKQLGATRVFFSTFWDFLVIITRHIYDMDIK